MKSAETWAEETRSTGKNRENAVLWALAIQEDAILSAVRLLDRELGRNCLYGRLVRKLIRPVST